MVREAFDRLRRDGVLEGWELDDKIVSPFSQDSGSIKLTVTRKLCYLTE